MDPEKEGSFFPSGKREKKNRSPGYGYGIHLLWSIHRTGGRGMPELTRQLKPGGPGRPDRRQPWTVSREILFYGASLLFFLPGILPADTLEFGLISGSGLFRSAPVDRAVDQARGEEVPDRWSQYDLGQGGLTFLYSFVEENLFRIYMGTSNYIPDEDEFGNTESSLNSGVLFNHPDYAGKPALFYREWTDQKSTTYGGLTYSILENRLYFGGGIRQSVTHHNLLSVNGALGSGESFQFYHLIYFPLLFTENRSESLSTLTESTIRTGPEIKGGVSLPLGRTVDWNGELTLYYGYGKIHSRYFDLGAESSEGGNRLIHTGKVHGVLQEAGGELDTWLNFHISRVFSMRTGIRAGVSGLFTDGLNGDEISLVQGDLQSLSASDYTSMLLNNVDAKYTYDDPGKEIYGSIYFGFTYSFQVGRDENQERQMREDPL